MTVLITLGVALVWIAVILGFLAIQDTCAKAKRSARGISSGTTKIAHR